MMTPDAAPGSAVESIAPTSDDESRARRALTENPTWYHSIELAPGIVTPGFVDWRASAARILPPSLSGLRALDVGTFDGFWSFEMEKRGADVVAIDVDKIDDADWPPRHRERLKADTEAWDVELGRGFRVAKESLGSSARRVVCSVLELTPDAVGGQVDVAFLGALLLHLRDPVRALENIRRTLRPGGVLTLVEVVALRESVLHPRTPIARFDTARSPFNWWLPNIRALHDLLWGAGFDEIQRVGRLLRPPARREMRCWYCAMTARAPSD
jgi:SAM-dependent methyltransferase